jgi:hypothetical protein
LVINSSLLLILHCPFSFVGPYIFLNIFLYHVINITLPPTLSKPLRNWTLRYWSIPRTVLTLTFRTITCLDHLHKLEEAVILPRTSNCRKLCIRSLSLSPKRFILRAYGRLCGDK